MTDLKKNVTATFQQLKSELEGKFSSIKSSLSSAWSDIERTASSYASTIQSNVTSGFSQMQSSVENTLRNLNWNIENSMNSAKWTVQSAMDTIRYSTNFSWSLPYLAMPHIWVTGQWGFNPPSVPSFEVHWYKDAMKNGMILNNPTIFGMLNGTLLGGGDAGSETVVGTHSLLDMIRNAVSNMASVQTINYGGVTVNVYGHQGQDIKALADEIEERISLNTIRRRAGFA
jgi:phage-related minor tail protein